MAELPDLSRFELQLLRRLWTLNEGTARQLQAALTDKDGSEPNYSSVRKILERLEGKGAVERVRQEQKAWIYTASISQPQMVRKEVKRFLDSMFDGLAGPLMTHLADMNAVTAEDLQAAHLLLGNEEAESTEKKKSKDKDRNKEKEKGKKNKDKKKKGKKKKGKRE